MQSNLLLDIDESHRSLLSIDTADAHTVTVLTTNTRTSSASQNNTGQSNAEHWSAFFRFVEQDVWHIWTGFDHLAFNYVQLPSRWVETAITASIVITGIANLLPRASRYGIAMAFGFGLIHGLSFASALAEITEHAANRLVPVLGFNIGVEVRQLMVVAALFPLLFLNKGSLAFKRHAVTAGSLCVSALGIVWFVQRALLS